MSEIRVLQIVDSLSKSSGVMSVIMNFYRKIDRSLIQFDFVVNFEKENNYEKEIIGLGGKIFKIDTLRINNLMSVYKQINNLLNENKYTIIHSHTPTLTGIYFYIAKKNGVEYRIMHSHSTMYSSNKIKSIRNFFLCILSKKFSNKNMACSKLAGQFMFGKHDNFTVLNNSVDREKFKFNIDIRKKIRNKFKLKNDEILFGHIGRMEAEKNHEFLIEIFSEITKLNKNSKLILVGDGSCKENIINKCMELKIEKNVIYTGIIDNTHEIMQAMDILIFPSKFEGLPLVCVEAQIAGVQSFISNNITKEVLISDYIYNISLKDNKEKIAKFIIDNIDLKSDRVKLNINYTKFDLVKNTEKLQKYYINLWEKK